MKHIVQFSGGMASSYVAYLIAKQFKASDIILLFHDTKEEHPDAYRFRKQISNFIGIPMTEISDGRSLWEVIDSENCLPSSFIPFCTRILKQIPGEKFYKEMEGKGKNFIIYNGFGIDEWRRIQRATARGLASGRTVKSPLYENKITSEKIMKTIKEEWKICLPEPYKTLKHNNCIPCFKAGLSEWKKYWKYYPEKFQKAIEYEEKIGHTVFKEKSLREYKKIWENDNQLDMFNEEEFDLMPCLCAI